ncbi:hypothetical protein EDD70_2340 [Hydrogenoanaerobacterium saccharovorans]|uniref:Uncharacterized protein n=1 Tax=Hydrogenoanaerobacterium saccharovorans TaxID=474960 RepID=A0A1H8CXM5_9FIRM|nr:relaxase MobL [Hydrogenoanaerobacterium saccharovorans]RPF43376.1 hypothetical protein EDD70_2340 [Hydrogenoanaerobacterium saccharovorans]SEM99853.1 hypothetical protein SAMN05216180_2398 [Hydrogenoanaerobacterium saccharovorans]
MVVFKQLSDIKKDGTKYNKQDYMFYTNYIATRDGAVYGDELEHGLFGKYGDIEQASDIKCLRDAETYVGNIYDDDKEIYRCVISLTEEEAVEFGYTDREKWTELLNSKMFDIGEEYHIKYADLEYMASVHFEPGHPHVQFNFWDKNQTIKNKIISKPQFEKRTERVRACLAKEVYKDNIRDILQGKEMQEKTVVSGFNAFLRGISQQEITAAELDLKSIFPELCEEKMMNIKDMDDRYLSFVYDDMQKVEQSILEHYPKGALKYKYLPSECKETLNSLTDTILQHPDFRKEFNCYLHSVKLYSTALGNGSKTIADTQRKAAKEIYKKFGNRILNNLKENIHLPTQGGVDIVINEALDAASIFDQRIINLCDDNRVFHLEDLDGNERLQWRVSKLEKLGAITNYGMRYEVSQEFAEKVKELVSNFKQNKLWGIDRHFVELKQFTLDDLKGHPKNEKGKMEKRLPLLLVTGLIEEKDGAYVITKEYRELYKMQLERYKQEQFENWFKENIDNDVTISIYDGVFLRMGENGAFTRADMEQADNSSKTEFRLRRLVAEDYILNDGDTFTLTEKFREEIGAKLEEFKSRLYRVDKAFVHLECFTIKDIQANEENRKKNEMDELGAMEKRLPALLATGFVLEQDGVYMVSDEYRTAVLTSTADYHQKYFDEKNQAQSPNISRLNLFDSEFLCIAKDNQFSQAEIEQHNESGRLDWRLRQLIGSGLIEADGIQYTLTDRFLKKIAFTQKLFEKNFKVEYKDSAFVRLAVDGCISKETLPSHKNSSYLKWRIYGLQYKGLVHFDGSTYSLTDEFYENIALSKEKYCKTFQVRLVDKLFERIGNEFTTEDIAAHPQADLLIGRLEGLRYKGLINFDGESYSITEELKQQVQNCSENFLFKASDGALLKFLEGDKTEILKTAIENDFRYDWLKMRLQEFLIKDYAKENENKYILTKDAVEGIKEAAQSNMGEFRLRYFDSNFLEFDSCFTLDDVECHKEGLFLVDRIRALVKNEYLEAEDDHYMVTDKLFHELEELDESVEPNAFDMNLLRMADEDNTILHSTISELESPIRTEYRLQDLICKGYVTHNGDGYLLEDDFVEQVNQCYEEFKSHFLVQPYDDSFIQLSKEGVLEEKALSTMDDFIKKRLSSLLLIEYVKKEDDRYIISDTLKQEVCEAKESFTINHFDYDIVRLSNGNGKVPFDKVLNSANGEYLERRVYSLIAMGEITLNDGQLMLTQHFCNAAKLAHQQFDAHFKISSYDIKFLQLNGTLVFSKDDLEKDEDFVYLSSRLRSLVQQGYINRLDEDTYKISDDLITDAQKAFDEFELFYSDIRFLRINGTNQFTDEEMDYSYSKRLRELMQQGCINKSEDTYSMGEKFVTDVQALYDEFKEDFTIQPCDGYFTAWAKDGGFRLEDLNQNEFFTNRLYSLLLLEYIKKDGEQYVVTEELKNAVIQARQEFSFNHYDIELIKISDKYGNLTVTDVLSNINADYLEKRMYSLIATGHIRMQGDRIHLPREFICAANQCAQSYISTFKVNCYDSEFFKLGTKFTKEQVEKHEDSLYLKSRLRSLLQKNLIWFDGKDYNINPLLAPSVDVAIKRFEIKGTDNRFLQINGTGSFSQKEADAHFELGARLRDLCSTGWIMKTKDTYTVSEQMKLQIKWHTAEFAQTKIGIWDLPFRSLAYPQGFTKADLKVRFSEQYEALSNRLDYLHANDLFEKIGERYFIKQPLLIGIERAEQVQRGFRRQAAVSLLMDVYKLFSKTVNQENLSRSNKRKHFKDMSEEAKKDMAAEQSSAGTSWEEYER